MYTSETGGTGKPKHAYLAERVSLDQNGYICFRRAPRDGEILRLRYRGFNLRSLSSSSRHPRIFRMHRLDVAYPSSVFGPFSIFVKPSRHLIGYVGQMFSSYSISSAFPLVPSSLFHEKARISLVGSSKRRRSCNSRWSTSIFLLKINGHDETQKNSTLLY